MEQKKTKKSKYYTTEEEKREYIRQKSAAYYAKNKNWILAERRKKYAKNPRVLTADEKARYNRLMTDYYHKHKNDPAYIAKAKVWRKRAYDKRHPPKYIGYTADETKYFKSIAEIMRFTKATRLIVNRAVDLGIEINGWTFDEV